MSFSNPSALWLLVLVGLGILGSYFYPLLLRKRLSAWINQNLWPQLIPEFSNFVFFRKILYFGLSLIFLVVAMAKPQWGEQEETIRSQGMDILFLLDLSNSMSAEDTPPSRLNRAQTFIKKTLQNLENDRAGIVAFAGKSFLTVPLTTDFGYVSEVTDTLDPSAMVMQGTNISSAIETGVKAFERSSEDNHKISRAIILISDGEDFGPDAIASAQKLKDFGAGFFTVSVGNPEGAPIPIRNESGILQTYKKDNAGKPILSRVNRDLLSKLADAGGGTFIELVNPEDAAYTITKALKALGRSSTKEQHQVVKIDRFHYFVALSLLFLFLNLLTSYRPLLLIFLFLIPTISTAQTLNSYLDSKKAENLYQRGEFDGSAKSFEEARKSDADSSILQFNEATALAKGKHNEDAIHQFNETTKNALSAGDYETAAKSLYNEGVIQSTEKNLKEAYDKLTKAIELSKISNQPELEEKARGALSGLIQKQKEKSKSEQESKDKNKDQDKEKEKKGGNKEDQDKNQQNQKQKQNQEQKQPEDGKKREFKSGTLSKDVAESIMNDLSDREKQLFQRRMKERRTREVPNDKDW